MHRVKLVFLCWAMMFSVAASAVDNSSFTVPFVLAASSDYDVGGSNSTYTGGGLAPDPVCQMVCDNSYHSCAANCYRGAIEEMAMCQANCRISYCRQVCSK